MRKLFGLSFLIVALVLVPTMVSAADIGGKLSSVLVDVGAGTKLDNLFIDVSSNPAYVSGKRGDSEESVSIERIGNDTVFRIKNLGIKVVEGEAEAKKED